MPLLRVTRAGGPVGRGAAVDLLLESYPADALSVGAARHAVDVALLDAGIRDDAGLERARLIVDELVWNVVLHAGTAAVLRVSIDDGMLLVEVGDGSADGPKRLPVEPDAIAGRGLLIVEDLADEWGWEPVRNGKIVWARLRLAPAGSGGSAVRLVL